METTATLVLPARYAPLAADELTYLDGGALHGLWANWNAFTFMNSFAVMLGGATLTTCTDYLIKKHKETGSLSAAVSAAVSAVGRRSLGQQILLGACGVAAVYAFAYQTVLIYGTLSSLYYSIFPRKSDEDADSSSSTGDIDISTLSPIVITI